MTGAIDIGGTKIAVAIVAEEGRIVGRDEWPTRLLTPSEAVSRMAQALSSLSSRGEDRIEGIGIGCTGPVDPVSGVVGDVDLLPGWQGFPLVREVEAASGIPTALENDADAAALAEAAWGAGAGASRFIYVTISTGIGTGMVFDGGLYRGARGSHPEAGHQVLDPAGPECYCGARGCWESVASGTAMELWVRSQSARLQDITARDICRLAREGDTLALRAVERMAEYMGMGLSNLVNVFCPDVIALGGGVLQSSDLFLDHAIRIVRSRCRLVPSSTVAITPALLLGDAPLLGAARVWQFRAGTRF